jgi:hypothetical protein
MNFLCLQRLFGEGRLPTVVSDELYVLDTFARVGFNVLHSEAVSEGSVQPPTDVLLVPAAASLYPKPNLLSALKSSAVLVVPLLAFSTGKREVDYIIERLANLSFVETCAKNLELLEYIQHTDKPIVVRSPGCTLEVELGIDLDIMIPLVSPKILIGQWISIIQLLEVGIVPNSTNTSFKVNGSLSCDGVTIAHHLHSHFQAGPIANEAWELFGAVRAGRRFPLTLEIENSSVLSVLTQDGEELINKILPLTDEMMRGGLTEVAFAALSASSDTDWSVNSQLNEPAGGFHIGIGAGETAAHIDFVSPHASYS